MLVYHNIKPNSFCNTMYGVEPVWGKSGFLLKKKKLWLAIPVENLLQALYLINFMREIL
jgi:hypothetical protein